MIRLLAIFSAILWGALGHAEPVKLAVTTSFHNSGLSDVLLPAIAKDTGLDVQLLVVGTGQALKLGKSGDVDAILVHSKGAENVFVAEGYGTHRREIMYNDFVILGPNSDPARIAAANNATSALKAIAATGAPFVSRGDDSGTHKKELALWLEAGLDPNSFASWYKSVGSGMGASLNTAAGLNAYIMSDRASWLNFGNQDNLALLFEGDPELFNQYSFLPVSSERHPHVEQEVIAKLEEWLTSGKAATLINAYRINGEALFVFNASPH